MRKVGRFVRLPDSSEMSSNAFPRFGLNDKNQNTIRKTLEARLVSQSFNVIQGR